jgi:uncharacterized protein (TIGR00369 family)
MEDFERRIRDSFARQGMMKTLGAEMIAVRSGGTEISLSSSPSLTQQHGFVHAGAMTTILDSACGYAALTLAPPSLEVLTVEFKVNFLSPGVGDKFVARAQVKRAGKVLSVCTADLFVLHAGGEKLVATMLATVMNVPLTG